MIYAVDRFMDHIRVKKEREYDSVFKQDKYHYFDTENEARSFIRTRSLDAYYAAEAAAEKARLKHNRNCKKYPPIAAIDPLTKE